MKISTPLGAGVLETLQLYSLKLLHILCIFNDLTTIYCCTSDTPAAFFILLKASSSLTASSRSSSVSRLSYSQLSIPQHDKTFDKNKATKLLHCMVWSAKKVVIAIFPVDLVRIHIDTRLCRTIVMWWIMHSCAFSSSK